MDGILMMLRFTIILKTQPVPIIDSVEVDSVSQNYWIPGEWNIKVPNAHSGNQVWALSPAGGSYNYLNIRWYSKFIQRSKSVFGFLGLKKPMEVTGAIKY